MTSDQANDAGHVRVIHLLLHGGVECMEHFDVEVGGFGFVAMRAWFGLLSRKIHDGNQEYDREGDTCLHGMVLSPGSIPASLGVRYSWAIAVYVRGNYSHEWQRLIDTIRRSRFPIDERAWQRWERHHRVN